MSPEKSYNKNTSLIHRKKFAQFFTPEPIAKLMVDWLIGNKKLKTVLEPAFGLGIFSRIILKEKKKLHIEGFDIDEIILEKAHQYFKNAKDIFLNVGDYMYNDWGKKYDGIICNPPYLKFHNYDNQKVLKEVEHHLKFKFNGFTNIYTLFLLKSIFELKKGGRIAYIIPSEFLNSDYGKLVKSYLLKTKILRHIFVINFEENIFENAITTSCILLLANDEYNHKLCFTPINSKCDLSLIKNYIENYPQHQGTFNFNPNTLNPNIKWRNYYQLQNSRKYKNLVSFSNYAKVVRGIATGSNEYFTFRKSKIEKYAIPTDNLLPCICKSKDVKGFIFTKSKYDKLVGDDENVYLFDGKNPHNEKVSDYIDLGEQQKINERFLTKKRKPWYSLEKRQPAPIWVAVFNRNGIRFIRNEANIRNLTTFHCIYPNDLSLFPKISTDLLFAYLLTDIAKEIFDDNRREYGNGLKKFEPNDINKSKMLDLSSLSQDIVDEILARYSKFKESENINFIHQIDKILRSSFSDHHRDNENIDQLYQAKNCIKTQPPC